MSGFRACPIRRGARSVVVWWSEKSGGRHEGLPRLPTPLGRVPVQPVLHGMQVLDESLNPMASGDGEGVAEGTHAMSPHEHCWHFYQSRYALLIPAGFSLEKCCLCSETRQVHVGHLRTGTAP